MTGGRLVRLWRAVLSRAEPDDAWACGHLPPPERTVFLGMDPRDREHGIRVARRLLGRHEHAPGEVVRAALLHDCGKSVRPYNPLERVLVGFYAPHSPLPSGGRPSAAAVRRHHPRLGADLIRAAGGDPRVAELVERHHAPGEDAGARLVHEADGLE